MNKTEFINAVAEKSGLSKVDAKKAVEAFVETVSSELKEGGKVALLGFGSFSVAEKAARKGVNRRLNNQSKFRHANQLNLKLAPN
jgi:DNA-binding protein HU-beta